METSNQSDAGLKTLIIRMLKELSGYSNSIKMIQTEMKETLIEIKNNLQTINTGMDEAGDQINDLEHKEAKVIQSVQQEEKRIQNIKDSVRSLWDNFKYSNICIIGVPEGDRKSKKLRIYLKK